MPETIVFSLKDLHHHGGRAMNHVRAGQQVVFYNERRNLVEAVLIPPPNDGGTLQALIEQQMRNEPTAED